MSTPIAADRHGYRLDYLDALRGIAAILVVFHHLYQTSPFWPQAVRFSPARLLLNGRSSVIFFFVLSGFVLAYGLWRGDQSVRLDVFLKRRAARIYAPYAVAALMALVAALSLKSILVPEAAVTFNEMWFSPINWQNASGHLALLGTIEADAINMPSWSLVYELRISLLIPVLCVCAVSAPRCLVIATVAVSLLSTAASWKLGLGFVPYAASGLIENLVLTLHFSADFILGILLARAAIERSSWIFGMSFRSKVVLAVVASGLLMVFHDETAAIGSALVLVLALNSPALQRMLRHPLLMWLGRLSFSLYLTHMIVLASIVRLFHGTVSLRASILLAAVLMLPVATLFYQWVEAPAARWSRRIGRPAGAASAILATG